MNINTLWRVVFGGLVCLLSLFSASCKMDEATIHPRARAAKTGSEHMVMKALPVREAKAVNHRSHRSSVSAKHIAKVTKTSKRNVAESDESAKKENAPATKE